jgi:hypothetical protein
VEVSKNFFNEEKFENETEKCESHPVDRIKINMKHKIKRLKLDNDELSFPI